MSLRLFLLAGLTLAALATPARASVSPITAAFVAAAGPFNGFLEASDRLAAERAEGRLRRFAAREAEGRAAIIDDLRAWAVAVRRVNDEAAHAPTLDGLGPVFGAFENPIDIVVVPADGEQREDLARLRLVSGSSFDALYATAQAEALRRLEGTYVDYIKNGDDEVLRALSVRDLHAVRRLMEQLPRR